MYTNNKFIYKQVISFQHPTATFCLNNKIDLDYEVFGHICIISNPYYYRLITFPEMHPVQDTYIQNNDSDTYTLEF